MIDGIIDGIIFINIFKKLFKRITFSKNLDKVLKKNLFIYSFILHKFKFTCLERSEFFDELYISS